MNINSISVSRKGVWQECEQKYKYQYHLKIEPPLEEPFYFMYGKVIHKIAEETVSRKGKSTLGEVTQNVLDGVIPIEESKDGEKIFAPKIPQEYKNRMPEHLRSIEKLISQIGYEGETEIEFNLDLDPPNGKMVKGFIDRLVIKDGKYYIFDYKTTKKGRWRKNRLSITSDLQLRIYSWAVQQLYGVEANKIQAALYYLEGGNLIGAKFSQKSIDEAKNDLIKAYDQIKSKSPDEVTGNVGNHCERCLYRKICPFYRAY